tara:strand:- start:981 stop:1217 length:237 start_codon:yes stop_codon:yes gene_type:complete
VARLLFHNTLALIQWLHKNKKQKVNSKGVEMVQDVLVEVDDLHVNFPTIGKHVEAVRGVHFKIKKGETLGIVGESGSG